MFKRLQTFLKQAWRWQRGRQAGGYDKMLLLTGLWPLPFDMYLIRYPEGSFISPHIDTVDSGRHFRLNIVLWQAQRGGDFVCKKPIFETKRIKFFRPDVCEHSVTPVEKGRRYLFSIGWVRK